MERIDVMNSSLSKIPTELSIPNKQTTSQPQNTKFNEKIEDEKYNKTLKQLIKQSQDTQKQVELLLDKYTSNIKDIKNDIDQFYDLYEQVTTESASFE